MKNFAKIVIRVIAIVALCLMSGFGAAVYYTADVTTVIAWIGFAVMLLTAAAAIHLILKY